MCIRDRRPSTMFANQPRRTTTSSYYNAKTADVAAKPAARRFGTNLSNQYSDYSNALGKKEVVKKEVAKPATRVYNSYNAPASNATAAAVKPFQAATRRAVDDLTRQIGSISVSAAAPSNGVDSVRDVADPQMCTTYIQEILQCHKLVEDKFQPSNYIDNGKQTQVSKKVRCTLVDWMVEVHRKFKLKQETLFLAVNILDRFLSARGVAKDKLQLVGATCIFVASKWEDMWPPLCKDLVYVGSRAFTKGDIVKMEMTILNSIKFDIGVPTTFPFSQRFCKAAAADMQMTHLVSYLSEVSMHDYDMLQYTPSMVSAACTSLAQKMLRKGSWTSTLQTETCYTEAALAPCVQDLNQLLIALPAEVKAVKTKYTSSKFSSVAALRPADL
eukprot:TRINITY_DN39704_c0_g1_i1.p1 TRINITY_DN39704_c0_g1~~TRINITY_DN39704_c0_g1_i1.p1  ORF type:complete len:386 (-),score=117.13 TRINITY_DN39704_c0_g1_i1:167-1324(-)